MNIKTFCLTNRLRIVLAAIILLVFQLSINLVSADEQEKQAPVSMYLHPRILEKYPLEEKHTKIRITAQIEDTEWVCDGKDVWTGKLFVFRSSILKKDKDSNQEHDFTNKGISPLGSHKSASIIIGPDEKGFETRLGVKLHGLSCQQKPGLLNMTKEVPLKKVNSRKGSIIPLERGEFVFEQWKIKPSRITFDAGNENIPSVNLFVDAKKIRDQTIASTLAQRKTESKTDSSKQTPTKKTDTQLVEKARSEGAMDRDSQELSGPGHRSIDVRKDVGSSPKFLNSLGTNLGTLELSFVDTGAHKIVKTMYWDYPYPKLTLPKAGPPYDCATLKTPYGEWILKLSDGADFIDINDFGRIIRIVLPTNWPDLLIRLYCVAGFQHKEANSLFWTYHGKPLSAGEMKIIVPRPHDERRWRIVFTDKERQILDRVIAPTSSDSITLPSYEDGFRLNLNTVPEAMVSITRSDGPPQCGMSNQNGVFESTKLGYHERIEVTVEKIGFLTRKEIVENFQRVDPLNVEVRLDPVPVLDVHRVLIEHGNEIARIGGNPKSFRISLKDSYNNEIFDGLLSDLEACLDSASTYKVYDPKNKYLQFPEREIRLGQSDSLRVDLRPESKLVEVRFTVDCEGRQCSGPDDMFLLAEGNRGTVSRSEHEYRWTTSFLYDGSSTPELLRAQNVVICSGRCESEVIPMRPSLPYGENILRAGHHRLRCANQQLLVLIDGNESSEQSFEPEKFWMKARNAVIELWQAHPPFRDPNRMKVLISDQGELHEYTYQNTERLRMFNAAPTATNAHVTQELYQATQHLADFQQNVCGFSSRPEALYIVRKPPEAIESYGPWHIVSVEPVKKASNILVRSETKDELKEIICRMLKGGNDGTD